MSSWSLPSRKQHNSCSLISISLLLLLTTLINLVATDDDITLDPIPDTTRVKSKPYISPKIKPDGVYLFESFDDKQKFDNDWIRSRDPKYTGQWQLSSGPDSPDEDLQLLLPLKARHYAVGSKLNQPFKFGDDKPLIVQYEVQFREGLDCGGAYIKLLRDASVGDLNKLNDKTPYSIMFGPDKCGSESKLHFIIQYLNPKTHEYGEKHWKQAKYVSNLMSAFSDKKHHIFRLVLEPNNNFEIFLDDKSVGKGNLLEDMDPPINPPKEIVDPDDKKPDDWDEREQIDDPDAKKPDDWDEEAPKTIEDAQAVKPDDWLENEPKYIPDPSAKKPDDWEEMDGEWEAPLIENPACVKASGCGEWKRPTIPNPNYKGKWKPSKIDNPNYKGKWAPRKIANPDYFFDEKPFSSLDAIGAVSFELWSMADNIAFDNLIFTNDVEAANIVQVLTWQDKKAEADASSPSLITRGLHYLKVHPWLWAVLVLAVALPLFLFITYCCDTKKSDGVARRKKTDESKPDERVDEESAGEDSKTDDKADDESVADDESAEEEAAGSGDRTPAKRRAQQRRKKAETNSS